MNNIGKEYIDVFRQYLLSHNEDVRRDLRIILPGLALKYLSIIEEGFLQNRSIENIASDIDAHYLVEDLKQLQFDYYISLAHIYLQGHTNDEIDFLLANDNLLFKNSTNQISDEIEFAKEISSAIKHTERAAFKKNFLLIDESEAFHISEPEIKSAIILLERQSLKQKFTEIDQELKQGSISVSNTSSAKVLSFNFSAFIKYAAAAVIIGFIFIGGYYLINFKNRIDNSLAEKENTKEPKLNPFTYTIPKIAEQRKLLTLLLPESFGFVDADKISITIVIQNIGGQIDTLRKIYVKAVERRDSSEFSTGIMQISKQIDSLSAIGNTYLYNPANKKVILSLLKEPNIDKIININPSQNRTLYLKLNNNYFELLATGMHEMLIPIENKTIIEELDKVVFQN